MVITAMAITGMITISSAFITSEDVGPSGLERWSLNRNRIAGAHGMLFLEILIHEQ
jgi:hypothetical protein